MLIIVRRIELYIISSVEILSLKFDEVNVPSQMLRIFLLGLGWGLQVCLLSRRVMPKCRTPGDEFWNKIKIVWGDFVRESSW